MIVSGPPQSVSSTSSSTLWSAGLVRRGAGRRRGRSSAPHGQATCESASRTWSGREPQLRMTRTSRPPTPSPRACGQAHRDQLAVLADLGGAARVRYVAVEAVAHLVRCPAPAASSSVRRLPVRPRRSPRRSAGRGRAPGRRERAALHLGVVHSKRTADRGRAASLGHRAVRERRARGSSGSLTCPGGRETPHSRRISRARPRRSSSG